MKGNTDKCHLLLNNSCKKNQYRGIWDWKQYARKVISIYNRQ